MADLGTGYRNIPIQYLIEDPNFRDSKNSYFIQAVDLAAFLLYQHLQPSTYMRKKAGHAYFIRLQLILGTVASRLKSIVLRSLSGLHWLDILQGLINIPQSCPA